MEHNRDLYRKTIVITGATSGIGRAAAQTLALRGAHVIAVGRSRSRCAELVQTIHKLDPEARISTAVADLSSQRQVRQLAVDIRAIVAATGDPVLDVLINNAGSVSSWYSATEDGYEHQFAVNHLAPFLLTHELLPLLAMAPAGRIITTSSSSHYGVKMNWTDVMFRRRYSCLSAYQQSKLANVLFTAELNRRLVEHSRLRAYAADPGLVNTEIGMKGTCGLENWVWQKRRAGGVWPEKGAATIIFLAAEAQLNNSGAYYWKDCRPLRPSLTAMSVAEAARLWAFSEQLCSVTWAADQPMSLLH